jgi:hypothetical protein
MSNGDVLTRRVLRERREVRWAYMYACFFFSFGKVMEDERAVAVPHVVE